MIRVPPETDPQRSLRSDFDVEALTRAAVFPRVALRACPHCGTTRDDVRRDEMLGCPLCYVVFEEDVLEIVS